MKTGAKIGLTVVVIIVLLMCCCAGSATAWYFMAGPGSYQVAEANKLVDSANKRYDSVNTSSAEMEASMKELGAGMDENANPQAIQNFQDEVTKLESKAQEIMDELDRADTELNKAKNLRLPAWFNNYIGLLIKRDTAMKDGLSSMQTSFQETRKLVGSISYVIDAVDRMTTAFSVFEDAMNTMSAGDYAGAQAKINAADASLAAADTALKTANETIKAKDMEDMIALNQKVRDALPIMSQFIAAAQASDLSTMTALQPQITQTFNDISLSADSSGMTGDFATWFDTQLTAYKDAFTKKFKEADKYEQEAKALRQKNANL
jgi:hypothetical protein